MLVYVYLFWNPHSYPASHILQGYEECCAGFPHFLKQNFQSVSSRMIFLKYWFFFFFLSPISSAEMLGSEFPATGERWGSSKRRHGWRDASWRGVLRTPGTTRSLQLAPWLPWWLREKESACNAGDRVRSLGWEDPLETGLANHSSILAWRIPWTEETCRLQPCKNLTGQKD